MLEYVISDYFNTDKNVKRGRKTEANESWQMFCMILDLLFTKLTMNQDRKFCKAKQNLAAVKTIDFWNFAKISFETKFRSFSPKSCKKLRISSNLACEQALLGFWESRRKRRGRESLHWCPRLCSNGTQSPEASNICLRATRKMYRVARPGNLFFQFQLSYENSRLQNSLSFSR